MNNLIELLKDNEKLIPLTKGQFAVVDAEDYGRLMQHKWHARKPKTVWYAVRVEYTNGKRRTIAMHRDIKNAPGNSQVDHVNRNGLDNRKHNLRLCTASQNEHNKGVSICNKSGFKGVSWSKQNKRWKTCIVVGRKSIHLGYHFCLVRAAKAYDTAVRKYRGEFGYTNFREAI